MGFLLRPLPNKASEIESSLWKWTLFSFFAELFYISLCLFLCYFLGKDVIYSQDLGYSILGLRILNPGNLVLGLRFKDPES